jgi:hypothetical protein
MGELFQLTNLCGKVLLPLKVWKVFLWFLHRGVILTKDNLVDKIGTRMRNVAIIVIMKLYSISFFQCHMVRLIWRITHTTFSLKNLTISLIYMFGTWLQGIRWKEKNLILTDVSAVCWVM